MPLRMNKMKITSVPALVALAASTLHGMPPTNGAQWWTTDPSLDCTSIHAPFFEVQLDAGGKGFACLISGTFSWMAAGGGWSTAIRAAAPASGAIGIQYLFFDADGNRVSLDTAGSLAESGSTVGFALQANQPSEVRLLGPSVDIPQYSRTQTGSVLGFFFCPSPAVCTSFLPQLLYSFLPSKPWLLSVPIAWENSFGKGQTTGFSTRWSASGFADPTHTLAFAIYNQSSAAASYTVRVFNGSGALAAEVLTPLVPGFNPGDGEGGTRGFSLSDLLPSAPPRGPLKVIIDGANTSSVVFLQFDGDGATSLETAHE
jgi:hypothetical protein